MKSKELDISLAVGCDSRLPILGRWAGSHAGQKGERCSYNVLSYKLFEFSVLMFTSFPNVSVDRPWKWLDIQYFKILGFIKCSFFSSLWTSEYISKLVIYTYTSGPAWSAYLTSVDLRIHGCWHTLCAPVTSRGYSEGREVVHGWKVFWGPEGRS